MAKKTNENMALYNSVREVPQSAQKSFNNGRFSGTDINPMWRIEVMTQVLGPCGVGWTFTKPEFVETTQGGVTTVHCTVGVMVRTETGEWSAPAYGVGGNTLCDAKGRVSDEAYKMAYTDAQSNACKLIGVGADIWYNQSETKYTAQAIKSDSNNKLKDEALSAIASATTEDEVARIVNVDYAEIKDLIRQTAVDKVKELRSK